MLIPRTDRNGCRRAGFFKVIAYGVSGFDAGGLCHHHRQGFFHHGAGMRVGHLQFQRECLIVDDALVQDAHRI